MDGEKQISPWKFFAGFICLCIIAVLVLIAVVIAPEYITKPAINKRYVTETVAMLSAAYRELKEENKISSETKTADFIHIFTEATEYECGKNKMCLKLKNGGALTYNPQQKFNAQDTTRFITFNIDPDAEGPAAPASILVFDNGAVRTGADAQLGIPGPDGVDVITKNPDYLTISN